MRQGRPLPVPLPRLDLRLDGRLVRAKHTEDLDDFTFDTYGLAPIRLETWQGFVFLCFAPSP